MHGPQLDLAELDLADRRYADLDGAARPDGAEEDVRAAPGSGRRMTDRVPVPREVLDGLEAVRRSGGTNMLDRPRVGELSEAMSFEARGETTKTSGLHDTDG